MAFVQAQNMGRAPQKESVLDKINKGVSLASNIIGTVDKAADFYSNNFGEGADLKTAMLNKTKAEIAPDAIKRKLDKENLEMDKTRAEIGKLNREALIASKEKNGKTLPGTEIGAVAEANSVVKQLEDYTNLLGSNSDVTGSGLIKTASRGAGSLGKLLGFEGTEATQRRQGLEASQNQAAQVIGSYLEGGKLADKDVPRYREMLPNISDPPAVRAAKSSALQQLVSQKQGALIKGFKEAGYDTSRMTAASPNVKGLKSLIEGTPEKDASEGIAERDGNNKAGLDIGQDQNAAKELEALRAARAKRKKQ